MNYTFTTEDKEEDTMLTHAAEAWAILLDIRSILRSQLKHGEDDELRACVESIYREVCLTISRTEQ